MATGLMSVEVNSINYPFSIHLIDYKGWTCWIHFVASETKSVWTIIEEQHKTTRIE